MLQTKDGRAIAVEEMTWEQTLLLISSVLPEFTKIAKVDKSIKQLDEDGTKYTFYKASYQFGNKIIEHKKCYLPLCNGDTISLDDPNLPDSLREDLAYNHIFQDPFGLMLNKSSEFYIHINNDIQPHTLMHKGQIFGIARAIDSSASESTSSILAMNLNAGSRSLFMLPKIGSKDNHIHLQKKYGLRQTAPTFSDNHWEIFVDIAKYAKSTWRCEIIYFPRKWIDKLKTPEWARLIVYLINMHRTSYNIWHNIAPIWNAAFGSIEQEKEMTQYYMQSLDIAKRLFMLAANSAVGFSPAIDDNMAPINLLQEAYASDYKSPSTIIMEPTKFDIKSGSPIYYSINHPASVARHMLENSSKKSQIMLLHEVMRINEIYRKTILSTDKMVSSLYEVVQNTKFSYYHSNPLNYDNILDSDLIAKSDARFSHNKQKEFPKHSSFLKGCIKIACAN